MPLNFVNEGSGTPYIRFSVENNEWTRSGADGNQHPFDPEGGVIIDIENVKLGWLKLSGGRDWVEWPNNNPMEAQKPSEAHQQGFNVKFYSKKMFDDEPVREFSASGRGVLTFIKNLHDAAEASDKFGSGEVPVVSIKHSKGMIKMGAGKTRIPEFEIMGWKPRPAELDGDTPTPSKDAPDSSTSSSQGASDDVDFESMEI